jgi:hypothetical protein
MKRMVLTMGMVALFAVIGTAQAAGDVQAGKAKAAACAAAMAPTAKARRPIPHWQARAKMNWRKR